MGKYCHSLESRLNSSEIIFQVRFQKRDHAINDRSLTYTEYYELPKLYLR